MYKLHTNTTM